jgi:hypothetical protein
MSTDEALVLNQDTLAVFIDDTGHETFAGQNVYGLGGCAVLGGDLDWIVRRPWREVRHQITGKRDQALHAATLKDVSEAGVAPIATFFKTWPFARLGAVVTTSTLLHPELPTLNTVTKTLELRIADIAQWTPLGSLALIFEASKRADALIARATDGLRVTIDGKPIPVSVNFLPKSAGEPAMEVADFIVQAIGGQARHELKRRAGRRRDFEVIFRSVDPKLVSFHHVHEVQKNELTSEESSCS